jgi:cellulose synthase/poly-beta-1,6-N-acetylglucosamine synthase-like glycosyltransferase
MTELQFLISLLSGSMPGLSLSYPLVTAWMIAGTILLLAGWVSLPLAPPERTSPQPAPARRLTRMLGAAALALATTVPVLAVVRYGLPPTALSKTWADLPTPSLALAVVGSLALGAVAGWLSGSSRWRTSGVATWLGLAMMSLGFAGYAGLIVTAARTDFAIAVGLALLALEVFGLSLMLAYQFYALEKIAGVDAPPPKVDASRDRATDRWPFVAIQVACYNEPAEVVENCLDSLMALDYPADRRIVQLLDDSQDAALVARLERFCRSRGVSYLHRAHRRGYKAGALNDGLRALPADVELLAIVDADYGVDREYLRAVVHAFDDPGVGFLQTPQAYRNVHGSPFGRSYSLADAYFYHVVQPVRARFGSAIFCGTMGVLRRSALTSAGGWSEECVTEDAEASIRLLAAGWRGVYLPHRYGRGLAPMTMAGVRTQHRRWALGGLQMLRLNRAKLASPKMTTRQRVDFWIGGVFWTDGVFFLGMAATLSAVAVGSWFGAALPSPSLPALALAASAPVLLLWDGALKIRRALRPTHRPSYRDVAGILAFWYAVKMNDLRAALRGLLGARPAFARTPKVAEGPAGRWAAMALTLRATALETVLATSLLGIAAITVYRDVGAFSGPFPLAGLVLAGWLAYYALALAAAPVLDFRSRRAPASAREVTWIEPSAAVEG